MWFKLFTSCFRFFFLKRLVIVLTSLIKLELLQDFQL